MQFDVDLTADERVQRWLYAKYRVDRSAMTHLSRCEGRTFTLVTADDGVYACETGCEHMTLTADVSCPHGETDHYDYGEFGDIADFLGSLDNPSGWKS